MRPRLAALFAAFSLVLTGAGAAGCAAEEGESIVNPGGGEEDGGGEGGEGEGGEEGDGY
jgi:hypothetical protein